MFSSVYPARRVAWTYDSDISSQFGTSCLFHPSTLPPIRLPKTSYPLAQWVCKVLGNRSGSIEPRRKTIAHITLRWSKGDPVASNISSRRSGLVARILRLKRANGLCAIELRHGRHTPPQAGEEIDNMEKRLMHQLMEVKNDLKADIKEVKGEIRRTKSELREELKEKQSSLKWFIDIFVTAGVAVTCVIVTLIILRSPLLR